MPRFLRINPTRIVNLDRVNEIMFESAIDPEVDARHARPDTLNIWFGNATKATVTGPEATKLWAWLCQMTGGTP